jgi:hypothetical protein
LIPPIAGQQKIKRHRAGKRQSKTITDLLKNDYLSISKRLPIFLEKDSDRLPER